MADGLRMLEVLSSKYLELSGNKALIEYDRAKAEEFAMERKKAGGGDECLCERMEEGETWMKLKKTS